MLGKTKFKEHLKFIMGERYAPLYNNQIFDKIAFSFHDFLYWKKLELDYSESRERFLEDLQGWEYLKENFAIKEPEKKHSETDRLKDLLNKDNQATRAQL